MRGREEGGRERREGEEGKGVDGTEEGVTNSRLSVKDDDVSLIKIFVH